VLIKIAENAVLQIFVSAALMVMELNLIQEFAKNAVITVLVVSFKGQVNAMSANLDLLY
jgi:hypothetical protein